MTQLYTPPESDILVLGEMIRANEVIRKELAKLPTAGDFLGALQVVRQQCKNIDKRCGRLLGEGLGNVLAPSVAGLAYQAAPQSAESGTVVGNDGIIATMLAPVADKPKPGPKPKPATAAAPQTGEGEGKKESLNSRVLAILTKRGPMSSMEIYTALGVEPSSLYTACNYLKSELKIENVMDEKDGTRRFKIK